MADDDAHFRTLLRIALELRGHAVVEVDDGAALRSVLLDAAGRKALPAVVVSDIHMPQLDGISVTHFIRRCGIDVPIVLMTGFPSERKLAGAAASGASVVLSKPFSMSDLVLVVSMLAGSCAMLDAQ